MRITEIRPQERNPSRRNLYLDGNFALGLSMETLLRYGLRKGDEISAETLQRIQQTEERVNARAAALRYLGIRPRTVKEVRDKLREKEFGDEEIAATIVDLEKAGLLNDAEFARMYIRDRMRTRPSGALLLKRKLLLLGIDKAMIAEALLETGHADQTLESALEIADTFATKARVMHPDDPPSKLWKRVASFLGRRGFDWETVQTVVSQVVREHSSGEDDARPNIEDRL